jgi:hypothetical protein
MAPLIQNFSTTRNWLTFVLSPYPQKNYSCSLLGGEPGLALQSVSTLRREDKFIPHAGIQTQIIPPVTQLL